MLKKSFLISLLVIVMAAVLINDAKAYVTCSRCRSLSGLCLTALFEKVKANLWTAETAFITIEAKSVAFTNWCNPAGQCFEPQSGDPFFIPTEFSIEGFDIIGLDDLLKGRYVEAKTKFYDCELRDIYLCADLTVTKTFVEDDGTSVEVQVCETQLDYSKIPQTSPPYWDEGQIGKWYPEDLFCPDPWVFSNPEAQEGDFIIGLVWVQTHKEVEKCKPDGSCTIDIIPGDAGCFAISDDGINYDQVNDSQCGY